VSEEKGKKRQLNSRSEEKKTKKRIFGPVTGVQIFTGEKEDFADGGNRRLLWISKSTGCKISWTSSRKEILVLFKPRRNLILIVVSNSPTSRLFGFVPIC
jgi:hypothetical protein